MQLDDDIILEAIESHFRKHTGQCLLSFEQMAEYFVQVKEVSDSMNYPGNRDLTISQLVFIATQNQVIKKSRGNIP